MLVCMLAALFGLAGGAAAEHPAQFYDVTPRPIEMVQPGTIVGDRAPKGWTHLIIKSHPRLADEELPRTNNMTARLAAFIFTVFTADVRAVSRDGVVRYRLNGVGQGLGTRIRGKDVIISPETQSELGANLGIFSRTVFSIADDRQQETRIAATSPTMAVVDTFSIFQESGRNRQVIFRYVVLVEEETGRVRTLLWRVDPPPKREEVQGVARGPIEWLAPDKIVEPLLYIDDNEYTLGIPSNNAFGVRTLPKGDKQIPLPEELTATAGLVRFTPDAAKRLEESLWALMAAHGPPPTGALPVAGKDR